MARSSHSWPGRVGSKPVARTLWSASICPPSARAQLCRALCAHAGRRHLALAQRQQAAPDGFPNCAGDRRRDRAAVARCADHLAALPVAGGGVEVIQEPGAEPAGVGVEVVFPDGVAHQQGDRARRAAGQLQRHLGCGDAAAHHHETGLPRQAGDQKVLLKDVVNRAAAGLHRRGPGRPGQPWKRQPGRCAGPGRPCPPAGSRCR